MQATFQNMPRKEIVMASVLVPVDGSDNSMRAVEAACRQIAYRQPVMVHSQPVPLL